MATRKETALATAAQPSMEVSTAEDHYSPTRSAGLVSTIAARYGVDSDKMLDALKQTAFRQRPAKEGKQQLEVTAAHMIMLLVIANQYKLNPFTREIYAFPSEGGIVAIVGIDGWIRIINERPELQAIEFETAPPGTEDPWITCKITRSDRSAPVSVTEYLSECSRNTDPWNAMPRRMLRHKALIQCARVAFGFGGIFDPDDGDKIVATIQQGAHVERPTSIKPATQMPQALSADTATKPSEPVISLDQGIFLADSIKESKISQTLVCAHFEIGDIRDLPASKYEEAVGYIDDLAAGA